MNAHMMTNTMKHVAFALLLCAGLLFSVTSVAFADEDTGDGSDQPTVSPASEPESDQKYLRVNGTDVSSWSEAASRISRLSGDITLDVAGAWTTDDTVKISIPEFGSNLTINGTQDASLTVQTGSGKCANTLINAPENSNLTIHNMTFTGTGNLGDSNATKRYERCITAVSATVDLDNTTVSNFVRDIEGKQYARCGGGLYAIGSNVTLEGTTTFDHCIAEASQNFLTGGGALYLQDSNLDMKDESKIVNCLSYWYAYRSIKDGVNIDAGCGSAILARSTQGNTILIRDHARIENNTAAYGGTINASGTITLTIQDNAEVINNINYGERGSAIYSDTEMQPGNTTVNISGNACVSGNTSYGKPDGNLNITAGSAIGTRSLDTYKEVVNISDNVRINNNTCYGTYSGGCAQAISIYCNTTLNISDNIEICNNKTPNSPNYGAGIFLWFDNEISAQMTLKDAPKIDGNGYDGKEKDVYLWHNKKPKMIQVGELTGGHVGVYIGGDTVRNGVAFAQAIGGDASAIDSNNELSHIFNNDDGRTATHGNGADVVWGGSGSGDSGSGDTSDPDSSLGTCQIIRNGSFFKTYNSLDRAAANAKDGDIIEVYKSHTVADTVWLNKNVTVRPAPMDNPTASGAHTRTEDSITISRNTTINNAMVVISDYVTHNGDQTSHTPVDVYLQDLTFDGASADVSHSGFDVASHLHLSNVSIQNFVSQKKASTSAVWVWDGTEKDDCGQDGVCSINQMMGEGVLYLNNSVNVSDGNGNKNVSLPGLSYTGGVMYAESALDASSHVGISLQNSSELVVYRPLVKEMPASDSAVLTGDDAQLFSDDTSTLPVAFGDTTGGAKPDLEHIIHFGDASLRVEKNLNALFGDKSQAFNIPVSFSEIAAHHSSTSNVTATFYDKDGNVISQENLGKRSVSVDANGDAASVNANVLADGSYVVINGLGPETPFTISENLDNGDAYSVTAQINGSDMGSSSSNSWQSQLHTSSEAIGGSSQTSAVITNSDKETPGTGIGSAVSHNPFPFALVIAALGALGFAGTRIYQRMHAASPLAAARHAGGGVHGAHARYGAHGKME